MRHTFLFFCICFPALNFSVVQNYALDWDQPSEKRKNTEFLVWLFNESKVRNYVCVNDRWGKETRGVYGGYYTTDYDLLHNKVGVGKTDHYLSGDLTSHQYL